MAYEEKHKKRLALGQDGNQLVNLVVLVAVAFVILKFIGVIYQMTGLSDADFRTNVFDYFILPGRVDHFLHRPWTVITYVFVHERVLPVLANLLWLWAFGFILQDLAGNRKIIPLFIYGGIVGGIFFLLANYILPGHLAGSPPLLGSATGVLTIAVAATVISPRYRIFPMLGGGIPLWILTVIYVIIVSASVPFSDIPFHIAHLSAALTGFLVAYQLNNGRDLTSGFNSAFDSVGTMFHPGRKTKREKRKHFYKVGSTHPFKKVPNITQQRVDTLLDKINQKGYESLSDEEREILRRASEDDNL